MKGLILKDFLYLRQQGKILGVLLLFYISLYLTMGSENVGSLFTAVIVMLSSILVVNTFAYDEQAKWDGYALSLPAGRVRIVLAKYLLVLLLSGVVSVLLLAVMAVGNHGIHVEDAAQIGAAFGVALLFCGFLMPLFYKFGVQKARLFIILIFILPTLAVYLWNHLNLPVPAVSNEVWDKVLLASPAAVLLLYAASFFISCEVYRKKEF